MNRHVLVLVVCLIGWMQCSCGKQQPGVKRSIQPSGVRSRLANATGSKLPDLGVSTSVAVPASSGSATCKQPDDCIMPQPKTPGTACQAEVPRRSAGAAAPQTAVPVNSSHPEPRPTDSGDKPAVAAPGRADDPKAVKALLALGCKVGRNDQGQVVAVEASEGQLRDADLEHLARLPALETLSICGGKVTSAGLAHLKDLGSLQRLYLSRVSLTDEGLKHLSGLTGLVSLSLENTGITGKGLKHLGNLKNLEVLNLAENPIDDEALAHLKRLRRLDTITLRNTRVSGDGLVHLKPLKRLRVLNLNGCAIADESLDYLGGLKELRMLYLRGSNATDDAVARLKNQIPGLAVFRD